MSKRRLVTVIVLAGFAGLGAWAVVAGGLPLLGDDGCNPDPAQFLASGCAIHATDTGVEPAASLWGQIECQTPTRHRRLRPGGDPWPQASGAPQGNRTFRSLTVRDGDDFFGERCELGRNERRHGAEGREGTFALFQEGERRITFLSLRLPRSFPLRARSWQTVMQMKQAQPYGDAGDPAPVLELQVKRGALHLYSSWRHLWRTPIRRGTWTRIALDATYSSDPDQGEVRLYVSGRGGRESASPSFQIPTLRSEGDGWEDLSIGASIPSHLRVGLYRDPEAPCPPRGCVIHVDNVQVTAPIGG